MGCVHSKPTENLASVDKVGHVYGGPASTVVSESFSDESQTNIRTPASSTHCTCNCHHGSLDMILQLGLQGTITTNGATATNNKQPPALPSAEILKYDASWKKTATHYVEPARQASAAACGVLNTTPDPRFIHVTTLMSKIFQVPIAVVTLVGGEDCYMKSGVGFDAASRKREQTMCDAVTVPNSPTVIVVPDAQQDARFSANEGVATAPYIRFYAGAPLVASDGHRLGTLCIVDMKPRTFPAGLFNTLMNFAELVVRDLESSRMDSLRKKHADTAEKFLRSPEAFRQAVALVDFQSLSKCPVLYVNTLWTDLAKGSVDDCTKQGKSLWDTFDLTGPEQRALLKEAMQEGQAVELQVVSRVAGAVGRPLTLTLRPAAIDALESNVPVGIPSFIAPADTTNVIRTTSGSIIGGVPNAASSLWFAVVQRRSTSLHMHGITPIGSGCERQPSLPEDDVVAQQDLMEAAALAAAGKNSTSNGHNNNTSTSTTNGNSNPPSYGKELRRTLSRPGLIPPSALGPLQLSTLIGSGAYAKVFRAIWKGNLVAVKLLDHLTPNQATAVTKLLFKALSHPHIVPILGFANDEIDASTLWVVEKYCNGGTLNEACESGLFKLERSPEGAPNMQSVLTTAMEIVDALRYLHSLGIVHGDLNGDNVLVDNLPPQSKTKSSSSSTSSSNNNGLGFTVMVGDAALGGVLRAEGAISLSTERVSHKSPELLSTGVLSEASDMYAFGTILWELYNGVRAWIGRHPVQVAFQVTSNQAVLPFPEGTPVGYQELANRCLSFDVKGRPSAAEVYDTLEKIRQEDVLCRDGSGI